MATKAAKADTYLMRLPEYLWEYDGVEYFYDGELPVEKGRISIPKTRPEWARRCLGLGYEFVNQEDHDEFQGQY